LERVTAEEKMADVVTSGDVTTEVSTQEVMSAAGDVIAVMAGKLMMDR
jgi:hypothetical protein